MRHTVLSVAYSQATLIYIYATAKKAYAVWMCWCEEKQSSSVEISGVKLAYTTVYEAAEQPKHRNSQ